MKFIYGGRWSGGSGQFYGEGRTPRLMAHTQPNQQHIYIRRTIETHNLDHLSSLIRHTYHFQFAYLDKMCFVLRARTIRCSRLFGWPIHSVTVISNPQHTDIIIWFLQTELHGRRVAWPGFGFWLCVFGCARMIIWCSRVELPMKGTQIRSG